MNPPDGSAPAVEALARRLVERAVEREQTAHRVSAGDDVAAVRRRVRELARSAGVRIRTGVVDGVLVVVRADAAVWSEPAATMRAKLTPEPDGSDGGDG